MTRARLRDHRRLVAFQKADALVLDVYRLTCRLPRGEEFGLKVQMRRAAVSTAANLVEGCARESGYEFLRFLSIALASAKELAYHLSVAHRLEFVSKAEALPIERACEDCIRVLARLQQGFAAKLQESEELVARPPPAPGSSRRQ